MRCIKWPASEWCERNTVKNQQVCVSVIKIEKMCMIFRILPGLENCLLNYTSSVDNCLNEEDKIMKDNLLVVAFEILRLMCNTKDNYTACKI